MSFDDQLEEWDSFVDDSPQGCIFCRSWWLRAVCPRGFEILTLRRGGKIVAGMPMPIYRGLGYKMIYTPQLTQTLGVLLPPWTSEKYESGLSKEMRILNELVAVIPSFSYFRMQFHHNFTNWLPFYWTGYKQTTLYTYVILDLTDLEGVFANFAHSKRQNIRKAERMVSVFTDLPAEDFYTNNVFTLRKIGEPIVFSFDHFKKIYDAAHRNGCGKTWYALDDQNNIHAAIFVVFDKKSAHYLVSTIDPDFRSSGAATLLLKEAIAHVSPYTSQFNLCGSMIRGIENSFRKLGGIQTPYLSIIKGNHALGLCCTARIRGIRMIPAMIRRWMLDRDNV